MDENHRPHILALRHRFKATQTWQFPPQGLLGIHACIYYTVTGTGTRIGTEISNLSQRQNCRPGLLDCRAVRDRSQRLWSRPLPVLAALESGHDQCVWECGGFLQGKYFPVGREFGKILSLRFRCHHVQLQQPEAQNKGLECGPWPSCSVGCGWPLPQGLQDFCFLL